MVSDGAGGYEKDHVTNPQTDTADDRLISEHRGCAGKSFTKQVAIDDGADGTAGTADDIGHERDVTDGGAAG